jgi:hypothetical protein
MGMALQLTCMMPKTKQDSLRPVTFRFEGFQMDGKRNMKAEVFLEIVVLSKYWGASEFLTLD